MKNYEFESLEEGYPILLKDLIENGSKVSPRGIPTREFSPVSITIKNPRKRFIQSKVRKLNIGFMIAELLWILRGSNSVSEISHYNKNWANFSDDGITLNGAYGDRIFKYNCGIRQLAVENDTEFMNVKINQFEEAYKLLKSDPDTRQATIVLFNPYYDYADTKDKPCTNLLRFKIRNNKLIMTTFMRSNDCNLGTPYDIFNFTMLQEIMAGLLGIDVGEYIHIVDSFHMYERDINWMTDVINENPELLYGKTYDYRLSSMNEFSQMLRTISKIEDITRTDKNVDLNFIDNEIKKIENLNWRSYAAIIAVYNFRKYRRKQNELDILKQNITNEYKQLIIERYNQLD